MINSDDKYFPANSFVVNISRCGSIVVWDKFPEGNADIAFDNMPIVESFMDIEDFIQSLLSSSAKLV